MRLSPRTLTLLKYLFAFTLLGIVLHKVGFDEIMRNLKEISPLEGLIAFAFATCAQLVSAMRMRYFFTASGFSMGRHFATVLFYVGAFYNFLLPGGIGGDAYKVMLVRRRLEMPAMHGIRLMVADRASGLCIVLLTMLLGLYWCGLGQAVPYGHSLLILGTVITPIAYILGSKKLLRQLPLDMVGSLRYSIIAQAFWMLTIATLWHAIGHGNHLVAYITLYCASSIASLIPLSVGGLGLREMTYFYGAGVMQHTLGLDVNADVGIAISLSMFVLSFVTSLPGLFWLHKVGDVEIAPQKIDRHAEKIYAARIDTPHEKWN